MSTDGWTERRARERGSVCKKEREKKKIKGDREIESKKEGEKVRKREREDT